MKLSREEYLGEKRKLQSRRQEIQKEEDLLEFAWQKWGDKGKSTDEDNLLGELMGTHSTHAPRGMLARVLDVLKEVPEKFTMRDIEARMLQKFHDRTEYNRSQISSCLLKLVGKKNIFVVEPGSGRMPTTYRRK